MKAKLKCLINGRPFLVTEVYPTEFEGKPAVSSVRYFRRVADGDIFTDKELDFDLDKPQREATISGWVARDQSNSFSKEGALHVFHHRPSRDFYDDNDLICGFWVEDSTLSLPLADNLFPSLTWPDEPMEVEITIKPKKR